MAPAPPEPDSTPTVPEPPPGPTPSHPDDRPTGGQLLTTPEGPPPAASPPATLPGGGRYQFLEELTRGGMGVVYKVRDSALGRVVALKAVRSGDQPRPAEVTRFRREAEAVARLDHPHIIRLHEFGEDNGRPYFTMPLAEGGSLAGRLEEFSAAPRKAAALMEKVARAVACAHAAGVLHRDLKPSNVLLDSAGEPLVADFGLAKFVDRPTDLTQTGAVLGTPSYMAPEQAAGRLDEVGPPTDVWALGAMLYELLTGRLPFLGRNREEMLHRILTTTPPPPRSLRPELAPALEAVVLKCLRPSPTERYFTADALADDLARCLHSDSLTSPVRVHSRRRWLQGVLAAGGLAGASVVVAYLQSRRPPAPPEEPPRKKVSGHPGQDLIGPDGLAPFVKDARWALPRGDATTGRHPKDGVFTLRTPGCTLLELLEAPPWPAFRLEATIRHDEPGRGSVGLTFAHRCYDVRIPEQWCFCRLAFNDGRAGAVGFRGCRWEGPLGCSGWSIGGTTKEIPPPWSPGRYRNLALEVTPEEVRVSFEDWYRYTIPASRIHHQPRRGPRDFGHADWGSIRGGGLGICIDQGAASFRRVVLKPLG